MNESIKAINLSMNIRFECDICLDAIYARQMVMVVLLPCRMLEMFDVVACYCSCCRALSPPEGGFVVVFDTFCDAAADLAQ